MTTTRDVSDMLGIDPSLAVKPKSKKKSKTAAKRPDYITRELFQLLGERGAPLPIVEAPEQYKAKRKQGPAENVRWRTTPFHVATREDGLLLRHWRRDVMDALPKLESGPEQEQENQDPVSDAMDVDDDDKEKRKERIVARSKMKALARIEQNMKLRALRDEGLSAVKETKFARYQDPVERPIYDDATYESDLASDTWSREETDYLCDLYADFYGKWHLIWDRYDYKATDISDAAPTQRSMEDLKSRFYSVSAASMIAQTPLQSMTATQFALHEKLTRYNPGRETERKAQKARLLQRSKADKDEERILLAELDRIYKRHAETEAEGRDLRARLDTSLTRDKEDALTYTSSAEINGLLQKVFQKDREARVQQARRMQASGQFLGPPSTPAHGSQQQRDKRASLVSGPTPARHNISAATEARFGVKTFEKVQSGVTFKSDRERKARVAKSAAKTEKIAAILGELGVPEMLQLPTDEVCKALEGVVQKVLELIEKRRVLEREENDLKVEEQKKILDEGGDLGDAVKAVQNDAEGDEEEEEEEEEEDTVLQADADADGDAEGDADGDEDDAEGDVDNEDDADVDAEGSEINEEDEEDEDEGDSGEEEEEDEEADAAGDGDVSMADAANSVGEEDGGDEEDDAGDGDNDEDGDDEPAESLQVPSGAPSRKRSVSVLSEASGTSRGSRAQSKRRRA